MTRMVLPDNIEVVLVRLANGNFDFTYSEHFDHSKFTKQQYKEMLDATAMLCGIIFAAIAPSLKAKVERLDDGLKFIIKDARPEDVLSSLEAEILSTSGDVDLQKMLQGALK